MNRSRHSFTNIRHFSRFWRTAEKSEENASTNKGKEEFRELSIRKYPPLQERRKRQHFVAALPPRYLKQKVDQDWGNVWPVARSFHPATVPLPVRMGVTPIYKKGKSVKPDKWANLELMKIPNFLHLTPPVIKRQSEALKKFCTEWPAGLETKEKQMKHFPVTVTSSSYLHSSTTIRDERARIVQLTVSLKYLSLDHHGRDKLLRLVGERYDEKTDVLTLVADRCPLSCQNRDYCYYLLTVLYNESMRTESWESEKEVVDTELYKWEGSPSQESFNALNNYKKEPLPNEIIEKYEKAVVKLHNEGEDTEAVEEYKNSVLDLLGIPTKAVSQQLSHGA